MSVPNTWNEKTELTTEQVRKAQRWAHSLRKSPQPLEFFFTPDEGFLCNIPRSASLVEWDPERDGDLPRRWSHAEGCDCELCREPVPKSLTIDQVRRARKSAVWTSYDYELMWDVRLTEGIWWHDFDEQEGWIIRRDIAIPDDGWRHIRPEECDCEFCRSVIGRAMSPTSVLSCIVGLPESARRSLVWLTTIEPWLVGIAVALGPCPAPLAPAQVVETCVHGNQIAGR